MAKKKKAPPAPRVNRLTVAASQTFAHVNTSTILRQRRVLEVEIEEIDKELVSVAATVATHKARRAACLATLEGLSQVIARR